MSYLQELEKERLSINSKLKKALFVTVLVGIILFFVIDKSSITNFVNSGFSIIFTLMVLFMGYLAYKSYVSVNFNFDFKIKVMSRIINDIDPNLDYFFKKFIDEREFNYPEMYKIPDIYTGNDLIKGIVDDVEVKFSDLSLDERIETIDSKGNVRVSYRRIFKGICFIADFNKPFSSKTYIRSSYNARAYGEIAHMDDSEFEREFDVYTDDQINARYIITPVLMQRFLKLKKLFNCDINAAFIENKIYIYIEFNKDSFEPDIKQSLIGENSIIQSYQNDILNLLNLVKELNLNRKIFAKTSLETSKFNAFEKSENDTFRA